MLFSEIVNIQLQEVNLEGELIIPDDAKGLVIFSHGAGSSRHSSRNKFVADRLQGNGFGTLLFDLLTEKEDQNYENRFSIELLTNRLEEVTSWLTKHEYAEGLSFAYFGASTGAASALKAAARKGEMIKTVISRGGRADLAMNELERVACPVLLIVGGLDTSVIDMNKKAAELMKDKQLKIVDDASHLFEEPGKLEEVANLANQWLQKHIG